MVNEIFLCVTVNFFFYVTTFSKALSNAIIKNEPNIFQKMPNTNIICVFLAKLATRSLSENGKWPFLIEYYRILAFMESNWLIQGAEKKSGAVEKLASIIFFQSGRDQKLDMPYPRYGGGPPQDNRNSHGQNVSRLFGSVSLI